MRRLCSRKALPVMQSARTTPAKAFAWCVFTCHIRLSELIVGPLQDPALRNPLLKLLQWRYGYKDGDFERDPASGGWVDGEGEQAWEARPTNGGNAANRRQRSSE